MCKRKSSKKKTRALIKESSFSNTNIAFIELKQAFIITLIFCHYNQELDILIKIDLFAYIICRTISLSTLEKWS